MIADIPIAILIDHQGKIVWRGHPVTDGQRVEVATTGHFIFDGILVAALVLGALYAICRSGQRR